MTDKRQTAGDLTIDPGLLEKWALFYLERFASSAENLRRVLLRRARRRLGPESDPIGLQQVEQAVAELVSRYCRSGVVDDTAFAAARARSRLGRGQSLRTIRAGLAAKGVAAADTAAAIGALCQSLPNPDLAAACAFARRRRLGPYRRDPADPEEQRRALGAFARAGFDRSTASAVLACADPDQVEAMLKREQA